MISQSMSSMPPPPAPAGSPSQPQRPFAPGIPMETSVRVTMGPPVAANHNYSIKVVPASTSMTPTSKPKRGQKVLHHPKPTAADIEAATIVMLDHSYCSPARPEPQLPPPPPPPARKTVKVVKDEPPSRFKPIKYLLHRDENGETSRPSSPKQGSSRLENLLKRTSMYDGPSTSSLSTSPRKYNYFREEENIDVDVVTVDPDPDLHCDLEKAKNAMNECETHVNFARPTEVDDNWEDQIVKTGWTNVQRHLFGSVMEAFHAEHFARLAYKGSAGEVVLRRNSLDLTAQRVRVALVEVLWDGKLTQWLHGVLIDNLSHHYLAIYLDVLQTLRTKAPALVDRMIVLSTVAAAKSHTTEPSASTSPSDKTSNADPSKPQERAELTQSINAEALHLLIKRQWDPFSSVIHHHKGTKLKCTPVFLLVPAGPPWGHAVNVRRQKNFVGMLSNLGKVITVSMSPEACINISMDELAEKLIISAKSKLAEVKIQFPDRPIYLLGWGTGSIVAATASLTEKVAGVVCLGFPLFGIAGSHGEGSDPLLQMKHPILFVVGDRATNCTIPSIEEFREDLSNLQQHAYIVAIKSADEYLRVCRYHRKHLLVTQSYVDKCIVDEIITFVNESFDAKSSIPILPPIIIKNDSAASIADMPSTSKRKSSVNGELFEGLGLTLATLPNGHDRTYASDESQKKSRRKAYHRKSSDFDGDLSMSDPSGSFGGDDSASPSRSLIPNHQSDNVGSEQRPSSEQNRRNSSDSGSYDVNYQTQRQSFSSASGVPNYAAYGSSYPGLMPGPSSLFGSYPYFPVGAEAASAYSAAYAHAASQAAAIQHAIAMETVEGYNQYYSQLEKYNAQYLKHLEAGQKGKKPRKPRVPKPPGEKPPRKPRRTKAEKAAEALAASLEQQGSSSNDASLPFSPGTATSTSTSGNEATSPRTDSPTFIKTEDTASSAETSGSWKSPAPWISMTKLPPPNTPLPPPSTTMAALVLSSASQSLVTTTSSFSRILTSASSSEYFAVKSLPPPPPVTEPVLAVKTVPEPFVVITKSEAALRSPPLLIPTANPPNHRIPIRLVQTDGYMQEASLVPLPVDELGDGSSDLPPLVPVRIPTKIITEQKPTFAEKTEDVVEAASSKLANEIAVEKAKNLQVKIPRITIPSKPSSPLSSSTSPVPSPPVSRPETPPAMRTVQNTEIEAEPKPPERSSGSADAERELRQRHDSKASVDVPPAAATEVATSKTELPKKLSSSSVVPEVKKVSPPLSEVPEVKKSAPQELKKTSVTTQEGKKSFAASGSGQILSPIRSSPMKKSATKQIGEKVTKLDIEEVIIDEDVPLSEIKVKSKLRHTRQRHKSSSDEDYAPPPPSPKKPKRTFEDEPSKNKGKNDIQILESSGTETSKSTRHGTKKRKQFQSCVIVDSSEEEEEDDHVKAKRTPGKQSTRIESSEDEDYEEKSSGKSPRTRRQRSSNYESSDDDIIISSVKKLKRNVSDSEEVEPKQLRTRKGSANTLDGSDAGRRTRRNSKRQTYTYPSSPEDELAEIDMPVVAKKSRPTISARTTSSGSGSSSGTSAEKRIARRVSGNEEKDKRHTTVSPVPTGKKIERRKTRRSGDLQQPEIIDVEAEAAASATSSGAVEDEGDGDRRVTRSGSTTSRKSNRATESLQIPEDEALGGRGELAEDAEAIEPKKHKSIFPVTPASLSATRTRKVNIPKFYAYGM